MTSVRDHHVETARLHTRIMETGTGEAVLFIHGNLSNADVWAEQLELLPAGCHGIAPDLRGFGHSETRPVDATRGLRDFADDLMALLDALHVDHAHVVGHSMGGGIAMRMAIGHPDRVRSLVLIAPVSPYGFGGTRADGTPCAPDWAGSGGGTANADLVEMIRDGNRNADHPVSPINVVRTLFFPDPQSVRQEERLLDGILQTTIGDDNYPGDATAAESWPGTGPGDHGVLNTMSPKHCNLTAIGSPSIGGPVLWIRGDKDAIVSNTSLTDLGYLGELGAVPGWPGPDTYPAQPMIDQTRNVFSQRDDVTEEVITDAGHFVFIEHPQRCAESIAGHISTRQ